MTSSKSREPTIIIQSDEPPISEDVLGRRTEFADALLDVYVRQLRLMHAMMVELPLAWAAAREDVPPAPDVATATTANVAPNLEAPELLPAMRKRKTSASGEVKTRKVSAKPPNASPTGKKTNRAKGPAPTALH